MKTVTITDIEEALQNEWVELHFSYAGNVYFLVKKPGETTQLWKL